MKERLVNLEIRYTHLERQLDELSQVVFGQQKLLDRLVKDVGAPLPHRGPRRRPPDDPHRTTDASARRYMPIARSQWFMMHTAWRPAGGDRRAFRAAGHRRAHP